MRFVTTTLIFMCFTATAAAQRSPDRYLFVEPAPARVTLEPVYSQPYRPPIVTPVVVTPAPQPTPHYVDVYVHPQPREEPERDTHAVAGVGIGRLYQHGGARGVAYQLRLGADFDGFEVAGVGMVARSTEDTEGLEDGSLQAAALGIALTQRFRVGRILRPFIGGGLEGLFLSPLSENRASGLALLARAGVELDFDTRFGSVGYRLEATLHQGFLGPADVRSTLVGLGGEIAFRF